MVLNWTKNSKRNDGKKISWTMMWQNLVVNLSKEHLGVCCKALNKYVVIIIIIQRDRN